MGGRGSGSRGGGVGGGTGRASLPALQGSEKQVRWATDIRNQAYDQLDAMDRTITRIESDVSSRGSFKGKSRSAVQKEAEDLAGFSRSNVNTVRAELNDTFSQIKDAKTIIDRRANVSPGRIGDLVRLEARTGQVSAARASRKKG